MEEAEEYWESDPFKIPGSRTIRQMRIDRYRAHNDKIGSRDVGKDLGEGIYHGSLDGIVEPFRFLANNFSARPHQIFSDFASFNSWEGSLSMHKKTILSCLDRFLLKKMMKM